MNQSKSLTAKQQRAEQVNQAIRIISEHGRQFFRCRNTGNVARMEVDARGRVWFHDYYTRKRIYTHPTPFGNEWYGFTSGGTLRHLVERFRDYISTGKPLGSNLLGPQRFNDTNIWGYEEDAMARVRTLAGALPVFRQQDEEQAA
ncbi:hypothetical protein LJR232_005024 [Aquipseudomonas alcaligenes]